MAEPADRVARYRAATARVLDRIADACDRVGRDPGTVALVAVSKTVPAEALRDAVSAGLERFGENRVQEAAAKVPLVAAGRWELVGPLQSNKVRRAVEVFDAVESIDSVVIGARVARAAAELRPGFAYPVLLQVNVDDDPSKAGIPPGDVADAGRRLAELDGLEIRGLMTIGRLVATAEAARPTFRRLRRLRDRLLDEGVPIGSDLSMGMTDDFEVAVEEGATIVRVGRAIFGDRPIPG